MTHITLKLLKAMTSSLSSKTIKAGILSGLVSISLPAISQGISDDPTQPETAKNTVVKELKEGTDPIIPLHKNEVDPGALPVRVTKILIDRPKYKNILMLWETAQELNNKYFEVQQSTNSEDWRTRGRIDGKGNTSQVTSYEFTDDISEALAQGITQVFYRLLQVDIDGKEWTSNVLSYKLTSFKGANEQGMALSPNPARENVFVTGITDGVVVTDLSGRTIASKNSLTGSVELTGLTPGIYFVRSGAETKKLVIE